MAVIEITENHIPELLDALDEQVNVALEMVGGDAADAAMLQCPVDTGFLANSITYALGGEPPAITSYSDRDGEQHGSYSGTIGTKGDRTVYIGSNVEYAEVVEMSDTAKHKSGKAHFLRDALTDNRERYKQMIQSALSGDI